MLSNPAMPSSPVWNTHDSTRTSSHVRTSKPSCPPITFSARAAMFEELKIACAQFALSRTV